MTQIERRDILKWGIFVPVGLVLSACGLATPTSTSESTDIPKPTDTVGPTETIYRPPTKVPATSTATEKPPTATLMPTATEKPPTATPRPTETERPTAIPTAEKKIIVNKSIYHGDRGVPEASLTIDDGFSSEIVSRMLDTLKENNVQTTFFIPGIIINKNPELWQRAVAEGQQVCNHTYDHSYLSQISDEMIVWQINAWETAVENTLGTDYLKGMKTHFPFMRMPGGSGLSDQRVLGLVRKMGYYSIAWSVDSYSQVLKKHDLKNEAVEPIADEVVKYLVGATGNGDITLVHANQWDRGAFVRSVAGINAKGIKLVSISKLLGFV